MEARKQLQQHLGQERRTIRKNTLTGVFFMLICFVWVWRDLGSERVDILSFLLGMAHFCYVGFMLYQDRRYFQLLKKSGKLDALAWEFVSGEAALGGYVRLGKRNLFAKARRTPIDIWQISQIYQKIHHSAKGYHSFKIYYTDHYGKEILLCKLPHPLNDLQLQYFLQQLQHRNPSIYLKK